MNKCLFTLYLAQCGHYQEAMMSITIVQYRRKWLAELPLEVKCVLCSSAPGQRSIYRKVTRIETNDAEQLYLAKAAAMGATK